MVTGSRILHRHAERLAAVAPTRATTTRSFGEPSPMRCATRCRRSTSTNHPAHPPGGQGPAGPRVRHRLGRRGLQHGQRPDVEQLRAGDQRLHAGGDRRRRLGPDVPHRSSQQGKAPRPGPLGEDRREPRGRAPIPACSSTRRSTSGTPAPSTARSTASNPCSEYMFLDDTACNLASLNLLKFHDEESGRFDSRSYRHAIRLWTLVLEISVLMAQFPSTRGRPPQLRVPHPRPRLRQPRHPADGDGHPLRQRRRAGHRRRPLRDPVRRRVRDVGRDGGAARPLRPLRRQPRGDAARDPQSPQGCLRRQVRRVRRALDHARRPRLGVLSRGPGRLRPRELGPRRSSSASSTATATRR